MGNHQYLLQHTNTKVSFTVWLYLSKTNFPAFQSLHIGSQQIKCNQGQIMHIFNFREAPCSTQATTGMQFWQVPCRSAEGSPDLPRPSQREQRRCRRDAKLRATGAVSSSERQPWLLLCLQRTSGSVPLFIQKSAPSSGKKHLKLLTGPATHSSTYAITASD